MRAGIFFHVPAGDRDALIEWVRRTDQRIIRHQIEEHGRALVLVLHRSAGGWPPRTHLAEIETLPEPGAAMPYVGPLGGGYELIFEPCQEGYRLSAHVPATTMIIQDLLDRACDGSLPYDLPLSLPFVRLVRAPILCDEQIVQLRGQDLSVIEGQPDLLCYDLTPPHPGWPMVYGFGGARFERFRTWERFGDDPAAFSFHFRPYNGGCDIKVVVKSVVPELSL